MAQQTNVTPLRSVAMSANQIPLTIPTVIYVVEWKTEEGEDRNIWFFSPARATAWGKLTKIGDFSVTQWRQGTDLKDPDNKKSFFKGVPTQ